jgi:chloramphenicol 3-O-phosphotransferase
VGVADLERLDVFIYATETLVADRTQFGHGMLEALTLIMVNRLDRSPIHAAAVGRNGSILLLAGASGAGKSTLAYAAMRRGFDLVADDAVYLQLRPRSAVWGVPRRVCLLPDVRSKFPELASIQETVLANGKTKLVVPIDPGRVGHLPVPTERLGIVLLERSEGPVTLDAVPARTLHDALARDLQVELTLHGSSVPAALARVAAPGGWRLRLSSDPAEALPSLERIFSALEHRPIQI